MQVSMVNVQRPDLVLREHGWTRPEYPMWEHPLYGGPLCTADAWRAMAWAERQAERMQRVGAVQSELARGGPP